MKRIHGYRRLCSDRSPDLLICHCGYELRSSFVARNWGVPTIALAYDSLHVLSFEENRRYFRAHDFPVVVCRDSEISGILEASMSQVLCNHELPVVALDVSSMPRRRFAEIFLYLLSALPSGSTIDILYTPATFHEPAPFVPFGEFQPAHRLFRGWQVDPEKKCSALIGVGFEPDKALGILEYLEADSDVSWIFKPIGEDSRYTDRIEENNVRLIHQFRKESVVEYRLDDPVFTLSTLESLVTGLQRDFRVVVVPLGPKLFAALSMVMSVRSDFTIPVWTVSNGVREEPLDVHAEGPVIGLSLELGVDVELVET